MELEKDSQNDPETASAGGADLRPCSSSGRRPWSWPCVGVLGTILAVAAVYVVLGASVMWLTPSVDIALPLFPSAGFALAVAMIFRRPAWPGIALGAFLLNVPFFLHAAGPDSSSQTLAAVIIAIASTLQAVVGSAWLRRGIGYPATLDDTRSVLTFVFSAPAITLISASLSVGALASLGIVGDSFASLHWVRWWLGDTIGILVTFPLTMIVLGEPRELWRSRVRTVGGVLFLALLAFIGLYDAAVRWTNTATEIDFKRRSAELARSVQSTLNELPMALEDLEAAFLQESSAPLIAAEFDRSVAPMLSRIPHVQAIEWAQTIPADARAAFEAEQAHINPGFRITEFGSDAVLRTAQDRAAYVPIVFVAPVSSNESALGYDLASSPVRLATLREASELGIVLASPPLRLVQGSSDRMDGILLVRPLIRAGSSAYILIALTMRSFLSDIASEHAGFLAWRLTDAESGGALYDDFASDTAPLVVHTFSMAGRQYRLESALSATYRPTDERWEPWGVLAAGAFGFGLLAGFLLLISGYSARVSAQVAENTREIANAQRFLRQVIDCLPNPLFIKDASHRLVAVNDAGCAMFGRSRDELLGRDDYELFPPEEVAIFREKDNLVFNSRQINENEEQVTDADGNQHWILTRKAVFENADGPFLVGVITDLTERRRAELAVQSLALEDPLTGLPNRRLLQQLLAGAQVSVARTSSSIALLLIDLDQFKRINDTMGHSAGDDLLVEVAQRLREEIRASDVVGRLGGDEFAVIARASLDPSTLGGLAQRIVHRLSQPFTICDVEVRTGASLGIAVAEPQLDGLDATTFDSLLARADLALYAAKEAGRNTWRFFESGMHERACAQLTIERELREAIREQQLALQYQPIIRTADYHLCGFEALIRWHHPQRNLVMPGEFIPIAERNRQIIPITFWTLSEAIRQLAVWRAAGLGHIRVAVNLSTPAFAADGLLAHVLDSLARAQVPGNALVVEITEGALADHGRTVDVLKALRANGVLVAIDDFGAGYSSLGRLSEMPVDILKLDRSFLNGGERSEAILRAMIQLARNLGIASVVEGVETEHQFNLVRDAQADSAQGFGLCRPIAAEDVPDWCDKLDSHRPASAHPLRSVVPRTDERLSTTIRTTLPPRGAPSPATGDRVAYAIESSSSNDPSTAIDGTSPNRSTNWLF
jgi:PAS domain S-box/diguanylate cyclase (GGDEF) domain